MTEERGEEERRRRRLEHRGGATVLHRLARHRLHTSLRRLRGLVALPLFHTHAPISSVRLSLSVPPSLSCPPSLRLAGTNTHCFMDSLPSSLAMISTVFAMASSISDMISLRKLCVTPFTASPSQPLLSSVAEEETQQDDSMRCEVTLVPHCCLTILGSRKNRF